MCHTSCPLYVCVSCCRYHLLQPEYVLSRLQALQRAYRLAVLLLVVDAEEVVKPLQELHKAALGANAVLVCAWSNEVRKGRLGSGLCASIVYSSRVGWQHTSLYPHTPAREDCVWCNNA